MADGKGCTCGAYDQSECGCAADWTPQEVYDLRDELQRLKFLVQRFLKEIQYVPMRAIDCNQDKVEYLMTKLHVASQKKTKTL
jgi:hypothetical protein